MLNEKCEFEISENVFPLFGADAVICLNKTGKKISFFVDQTQCHCQGIFLWFLLHFRFLLLSHRLHNERTHVWVCAHRIHVHKFKKEKKSSIFVSMADDKAIEDNGIDRIFCERFNIGISTISERIMNIHRWKMRSGMRVRTVSG